MRPPDLPMTEYILQDKIKLMKTLDTKVTYKPQQLA